MELLINIYRPILIEYLQTKRTLEDARTFYDKYKNIEIGKDLLDIFAVMVANDTNQYSKELQQIGKRLTIGLLTYPKINFNLGEVIDNFKDEIEKIEKNNRGIELSQICNEKDNRYWKRILEDMDELGYYDDFIKHLLVIREELLANLDNNYNRDTIMDVFDLEFIKQLMYNKSYRFIGIYNFTYNFILKKLHPVLHNSFIELCKNNELIQLDDTSNTTSITLLQFIINNMLDFLYFEAIEY